MTYHHHISKQDACQREALSRATGNQSFANYPAIIRGFIAKGIAESEIEPRVNVFTFQAWKALGRTVCKGEHGVKIHTFVPIADRKADDDDSEPVIHTRPRITTVFHLSQTKSL